jgi:hypothetical protein
MVLARPLKAVGTGNAAGLRIVAATKRRINRGPHRALAQSNDDAPPFARVECAHA